MNKWTPEDIEEIWKSNGGWLMTHYPYGAMADAINAALAAEREKRKSLLDAGNKMRRTMYSNDSEEAKSWDDALTTVEENKT